MTRAMKGIFSPWVKAEFGFHLGNESSGVISLIVKRSAFGKQLGPFGRVLTKCSKLLLLLLTHRRLRKFSIKVPSRVLSRLRNVDERLHSLPGLVCEQACAARFWPRASAPICVRVGWSRDGSDNRKIDGGNRTPNIHILIFILGGRGQNRRNPPRSPMLRLR